MMRTLGAVGIAGLVVAGAYLAGVVTPARAVEAPVGKSVTPASANPPELAAMRQQLTRLEGKVSGERAEVTRPAGDVAPGPAREADPRTDPEARAQYERRRHDYIAGIEAAFRKEPVDAAWSTTTSSVVQSAI